MLTSPQTFRPLIIRQGGRLPTSSFSWPVTSSERPTASSEPHCRCITARNSSMVCLCNCRMSVPLQAARFTVDRAAEVFPSSRYLTNSRELSPLSRPKSSSTCFRVTPLVADTTNCSSRFSASRRLPAAWRATRRKASGSTVTPSDSVMSARRPYINSEPMRLKSNLWHREIIVGKIR